MIVTFLVRLVPIDLIPSLDKEEELSDKERQVSFITKPKQTKQIIGLFLNKIAMGFHHKEELKSIFIKSEREDGGFSGKDEGGKW